MSIFLILCGSTLYTWFKSRSGPPAAKPPTDTEAVKPLLADGDVEKGPTEEEK